MTYSWSHRRVPFSSTWCINSVKGTDDPRNYPQYVDDHFDTYFTLRNDLDFPSNDRYKNNWTILLRTPYTWLVVWVRKFLKNVLNKRKTGSEFELKSFRGEIKSPFFLVLIRDRKVLLWRRRSKGRKVFRVKWDHGDGQSWLVDSFGSVEVHTTKKVGIDTV